MSNHVIIKGKNDRLVIALNPDIDFLDICDILKTKILEAKNFIGNSRMAIEFSGRALTNEEENKLIGIITENSNIVISYIFSKRTDSEEEMDLENINPLIEEGKTHFFRGTLRSGSKIESDGNVVVLGDVNPSSIIKARGNVIVLGHLNGTVYAGLGGDDRAFIGAIYFNPIQLTIGMKTITDIQDEILDSSRVNKKSRFKVARIRNQEIVVEELI
ncbi:Septum site-determining protein MinC [Fusobacterium polymorphum]|jgi:probable septum site-determining protein minC|uniref:Probable septum site-determining protein MinC n=5 Tax=Fusobacterium TaxID=848 RepID=A0A323U8Q2_FUSNU|nr:MULTISPECIES: septum site-determining protein MinC [Fusobacterium]ALM94491.1 septum site-determining protein MinC [Fusobacterium polymorphum]ALQ41565.1 septum site-determining protein MinC [Fusobacterium polymorphum]ASC02033.1 septum site-determining protein MinC [Fusobacterium polymorphum]ASG29385.1 septum site-determining protein MinC [Fusobacterium polymorphum]EDK88009.1 cell division inhibitor MinC [Fusobacterium polymorphum ATCC 10953]